MPYFASCKSLEQLKKEYRRLAMQYHPDRGGDLRIMQAINADYDKAFQALKNAHNANPNAKPINETPEEFRAAISKIINLPGLVIELCGSWVWVSGETMTHREALKAAGYRWAPKKRMWYWRSDKDASHSRKTQSMDYIREKYGSEILTTDRERLTA